MELTPLILVAIVCFIVGFAIATAIMVLTRKETPSTPPPAPQSQPSAPPPPDPVDLNRVEIAHLFMGEQPGILQIEIGHKAIPSPEALSLDQRKRLEGAVEQLSGWLGLRKAAPIAAPLQEGRPLETSATPGALPLMGPFKPEASPTPAEAVRRPSFNPVNMLYHAVQSDVGKIPDESEKSIAFQVNGILQAKLVGTPLEKRGISLTESPAKELVVIVGLEKFNGMDAVPYDDVKAVIREAVDEWKQRTA